ncbi:MAG: DUF975 family protein [Paludibacteraceae bacterium]|nr:DUF975 family protein [Paludibacteraceae bacterium]
MKTPYEYRTQARVALQDRWGEAAIVSLIILVITMLIALPSLVAEWAGSITTILSILVLPLQYAYYISLLERTRGNEEELTHYTLQYAINNAYANTRFLVAGLFIMLISMVAAIFTLGIGAIIVKYMYCMVPYLLHDYPELTPREAMKISREMMSGQKWNIFILDLTFIGWILLSILTAGLGVIFVEPYISTARAIFYEDLKAATIVDDAEDATEEANPGEIAE